MSPTLQQALSRFLELYKAKAPRADLARASAWIIENFAPFRLGEELKIPIRPPTLDSGKAFVITNIALLVLRENHDVYWQFSGNGHHHKDKGLGIREKIPMDGTAPPPRAERTDRPRQAPEPPPLKQADLL